MIDAMELIRHTKSQRERLGPKLYAEMMLVNSDRATFDEYEMETWQKLNQDLRLKLLFDGPKDCLRIREQKFSGLIYNYTWWPKFSCEAKRTKLLSRTDIFFTSQRDGKIIPDNFLLEHALDTAIANTKTLLVPRAG